MESFFSLLKRRAEDVTSLLCVGLDPHPKDLPANSAQAALDFCRNLVDQTAAYAIAYKPNAAFFEIHGAAGWTALKSLIDHIRDSSYAAGSRIPVLLDAKRGDIASTAEAYAAAVFEGLGADAVTINPYLGADSITPFIGDHERGVFLLCKTSNPGAGDLQDLESGGRPVYEHVAGLAERLNTNDNIGLVVGATHLETLRRVRRAAPGLWFLAPGVGAQGAGLEPAMAAGLRADGMGMLIPVSRAIARSDNPRLAAAELRDEMARFRGELHRRAVAPAVQPVESRIQNSPVLANLAAALVSLGCVQFGKFTLKSGIESPIYIDLRRLVGDPQVLDLVAAAMTGRLADLRFDLIAALPYAALPIGTAVSLKGGWPLVYPRKEVKAYGTKAVVEGVYASGQTAVVLDDLITTGGSKFEGVDKLVDAGISVQDIVVLIDRSTPETGVELARRRLTLHAIFNLPELLDFWEEEGLVDAVDIQAVRAFLVG